VRNQAKWSAAVALTSNLSDIIPARESS